jgi:hypothetical protein
VRPRTSVSVQDNATHFVHEKAIRFRLTPNSASVDTRPSVSTPCACHCYALTEIRGTKPKACFCVLDIGRIDVDARVLAALRGRPSFEARTQPSLRRLRRLARGARAADDGH